MRKLITLMAALTWLAAPALAGEDGKVLRQKLIQAKQEKAAAMASHQLEAELMRDVKRSKKSEKPAVVPARVASKK